MGDAGYLEGCDSVIVAAGYDSERLDAVLASQVAIDFVSNPIQVVNENALQLPALPFAPSALQVV